MFPCRQLVSSYSFWEHPALWVLLMFQMVQTVVMHLAWPLCDMRCTASAPLVMVQLTLAKQQAATLPLSRFNRPL